MDLIKVDSHKRSSVASKFLSLVIVACSSIRNLDFLATSKEAEMTTRTTLTLKTVEVVSKRIPRRRRKLGQMLVFNENITEINNTPIDQFPVPSLGRPGT
jgi:hypothetical protein